MKGRPPNTSRTGSQVCVTRNPGPNRERDGREFVTISYVNQSRRMMTADASPANVQWATVSALGDEGSARRERSRPPSRPFVAGCARRVASAKVRPRPGGAPSAPQGRGPGGGGGGEGG